MAFAHHKAQEKTALKAVAELPGRTVPMQNEERRGGE
jgi:hypothetical protein